MPEFRPKAAAPAIVTFPSSDHPGDLQVQSSPAALRGGELCVCELCDALKLTQSTLSTHLKVLRQAEMVSVRRDGKWSYYDLIPGARPLVDSMFDHFAASVAADRRLAADSTRLRRRLARRDGGAGIEDTVQQQEAAVAPRVAVLVQRPGERMQRRLEKPVPGDQQHERRHEQQRPIQRERTVPERQQHRPEKRREPSPEPAVCEQPTGQPAQVGQRL